MLFLNNGAGEFREITHFAGLTSTRGGKGASFGDLDGDGDLDLVVPYFCLCNRIYRNDGINPNTQLPYFTDVTDQWLPQGADTLIKSTSCCLADIDNDGDLDLYITNLIATNRLYRNDGSGHFQDITVSAGLLDSSLTNSACFFDADNDGDLDLLLANRGRNLFFQNLGDGKFVRDRKAFNYQIEYSTGIACGDPDNDGDFDVYIANDDKNSFYIKNPLNNDNYLEFKLRGTRSNRDAIGARAFLYEAGHLNDKKYLLGMREVNGGYGYGCMNSTTIHFGVQPHRSYDLKVCFPSGIEITRTDLSPGQILIIEEQSGWAKMVALSWKKLVNLTQSSFYRLEFIKFAALILCLVLALTFIRQKNGLEPTAYPDLLILPIIFYLTFDVLLLKKGFLASRVLPFAAAALSFLFVYFNSRRRVATTIKEHLAEQLLTRCRAFDHGSWAVSYLNQLQLFSTNLPAGEPISETVATSLQETIIGFYDVVYREMVHIYRLALDASIQLNQASELRRQLLFLSENLNKIKVALALKQGVAAETWQNVHRLIDQIKMNIREINFAVSKRFSCHPFKIIQRTIKNFQSQSAMRFIHAKIPANDDEFRVCSKPSDLAAILENLFQNAVQATQHLPKPSIRLSCHHTDQFLSIEIRDNGCGIPKKLWQKIFEQNYTTKNKGNGGFGLYFARKVLEKYGGHIEVLTSRRNRGTTFLIQLRRV